MKVIPRDIPFLFCRAYGIPDRPTENTTERLIRAFNHRGDDFGCRAAEVARRREEARIKGMRKR